MSSFSSTAKLMSEKCLTSIRKLFSSSFANNSLANTLWNSDNKDFTFIIGSKEIKAHKFLLASISPLFKAIVEKESCLEVTEYDFLDVENAVQFFYEVLKLKNVCEKCLISLLNFAHQYEIQNLKNEAETELIKKLCNQNVCELANLSIKCDAEELKKGCRNYLGKSLNSYQIFKQTPIANLETLDKSFTQEFFVETFQIMEKSKNQALGMFLLKNLAATFAFCRIKRFIGF